MRYRNPRLPSDASVSVTIEGVTHITQLANASVTGARFAMAERPPRGTLLMLGYRDVRIQAQVIWSNGRHTAVRFTVPLTTAALTALRREASRGSNGEAPGRLLGFRELS